MIKDWHATLDKLPKNIYNFVTRYLNNTLPTLKNMLLWNKATSNLCYSCSNVQTLQHIVSSCKVHLEQGRYTWRHNSVLKNLVEYLSSVKKDLSFYADVDGFENPSIIAGLEVRPDMIIVNTTIRPIYVIELTIGFETNITKNCTRKTLHYKEFCNALKQRYDTVEYFNLSMGAIGVFGLECKKIYDFLDNVLGLDVSQRSFIVRKLCGVCIRSTYYLFCMRDRKWNNLELLYW